MEFADPVGLVDLLPLKESIPDDLLDYLSLGQNLDFLVVVPNHLLLVVLELVAPLLAVVLELVTPLPVVESLDLPVVLVVESEVSDLVADLLLVDLGQVPVVNLVVSVVPKVLLVVVLELLVLLVFLLLVVELLALLLIFLVFLKLLVFQLPLLLVVELLVSLDVLLPGILDAMCPTMCSY